MSIVDDILLIVALTITYGFGVFAFFIGCASENKTWIFDKNYYQNKWLEKRVDALENEIENIKKGQ